MNQFPENGNICVLPACLSMNILLTRRPIGYRRLRQSAKELGAGESEAIRQKNEFLALIAGCLHGNSTFEMAPLEFDQAGHSRAVFLVTIPITFGSFKLSEKAYKILAKHVGMSLGSVSHWALCAVDRGFGPSYCYDLMSDRMELNALGKNYFRVAEITSEIIPTWNSCYYVGETTRPHEEIEELGIYPQMTTEATGDADICLGLKYMTLHPRYHLISSNCQHLVDNLVKELCNNKVISQAKLEEELSLVSPRIARDLMVARLRSRIDGLGEKEESTAVQEDLALTRRLSMKVETG